MQDPFRKKILLIWLFTGCIMVFIMVAIGGITRLTHSGLSMVDWNLLMGSVPPLNEAEWQGRFEQYQQFPEYKELNQHFTLSDFKSIFWWEFIHRVFGRLIGLVFFFPFVFFLIRRWIPAKMIGKLVLIFFLGAFQAFLGWFMVKSGLSNEPRVSHYRLAAHLITAFFTCMAIWWVAMDILFPNRPKKNYPGWRKAGWGFIVLLILQIIYGALVAGLRAGEMHNTFPMMDGQFIADAVWVLDPTWLNFLEGRSGVQFIHRMLAMTVGTLGFVFYMKSLGKDLNTHQIRATRLILIAVLIQFTLGVLTLLTQVQIALALLHQLGALLLLGSSFYLLHSFRKPA